jgi:putative heme-binding domain-containing protein
MWLSIAGAFLPAILSPARAQKSQKSFGIDKRVPWTTSRISGSPEPPPPYRVERAFPGLSFVNPLLMERAPGSNRLFVGEHAGKIYSFPNDPKCSKADLFLDLTTELSAWKKMAAAKGINAVYGLAFHPDFARNRYCYICYVLDSKDGKQLENGTRLSRFEVTRTDPPRCLPATEKVILTWLAGGHNGGDLKFSKEGYLYISTGDGADPNPPDSRDTGQDISDLLSSMLRIDVNRSEGGKAYAVPADNPFVKTPNARPEIWAYGFRNPWRMSVDSATGDLWVGDVGWELWEMIYRVERGGNYGWSVKEGPQFVRPNSRRGPTPILPPVLAFPHTEAASITGGYVYHGKKLKGLQGAYICGDWVTRKLWALRSEGDRLISHKEIAQGGQRIVAFGEDNSGELYFLDYNEKGGIYQLVPNQVVQPSAAFPQTLSETGLFSSLKNLAPAPGVIPFSVNAEQWQDHARAERHLGLPGQTTVRIYDQPVPIPETYYTATVLFPKDGVLAKTISLEMEHGNPQTRRHLETQILHFDGTAWKGYTYQWNDDQTDAALVPAAGLDRSIVVKDARAPGGRRQQTWHFHGRAECLQCHNPWAGHLLAFTPRQIDREHRYGDVTDQQMRTLTHIGAVSLLGKEPSQPYRPSKDQTAKLVNPYDQAGNLPERARSYLQVNCAHCHQFGAGGTAEIDLSFSAELKATHTLGIRPNQGTFEIPGALLIAAGDPYRSVLYYRMCKLGGGRMPHRGSDVVDEDGLRIIHDWISSLRPAASDTPAIRKDEKPLIGRLCLPNEARGKEQAGVIERLLSNTSSALHLLRAIDDRRLPPSLTGQIVRTAMARPDSQVKDLFERFVPDEQRAKRLGAIIKPEQILALKGDPSKGKELFQSTATQCVNCHRINGTGSTLGPDLSAIGKKYSRAQILESILEPSRSIDPAYVTYLAETKDGQVHTGLLARKTEHEVILKKVGDKEIHIPADKLAALMPQKTSLMPELLLRDLTAQQVADLLEFLATSSPSRREP